MTQLSCASDIKVNTFEHAIVFQLDVAPYLNIASCSKRGAFFYNDNLVNGRVVSIFIFFLKDIELFLISLNNHLLH